jgi:DnaJ-class molecular chaperone with C-terminal Zn finger domain
MSINQYEILGLNKNATPDQIKKTYHAMVKKWHPDKCKGDNKKIAQQKISDITNAYKILGNQQKD